MEPLRAGGWLLVVGGLIALAGAFTPPYKQWYAPLPESLRVIAAHPVAWRVINGGFLVGTVLAAIGFGMVAFAVRGRPGDGLALAGACAFAAGTLFWVVNLTFRLSVQAWAADTMVASGVIPESFAPAQRQAALHFALFALLAFPGVAATGASALTNALASRAVAWTMITVGVVGAPIVTFIGPWMLYVPIVLFGLAIVRR